ncbi:MAG: hypothetical protein JEY99_04530 [Spirochaetales bacterium]|nr:hypothetical protein [Spirochaetales bacterium]
MNVLTSLLPYAAVLIGLVLFQNAWIALGLYHLGIIVFLALRRPSGIPGKMRRGYFLPLLIPGIVLCALAAPVMFLLWSYLSRPGISLSAWLPAYGLQGMGWILFIPYFSLIHPLLEEVYWRTLTGFDPYKRLHWKDMVFAGYHMIVLFSIIRLPWLLLFFLILTVASAFWRWAAQKYKGYGLTLLTHAVADASVLGGTLLLLHFNR